MADDRAKDLSGIIPAAFGCALAWGPGLTALLGLFQISKFTAIFSELGTALPVITEWLIHLGGATLAVALLLIALWPIVVLGIKQECGRGLGSLILLNGLIAASMAGLVTIALFLPLVVIINELGGQ